MKWLVLSMLFLAQDEAQESVERLGSEKIEEREKAGRTLVALGEKAKRALRRACESRDPEIRERARLLLGRIEEKEWDERLSVLPQTFSTQEWKWIRSGNEIGKGVMKTLQEKEAIILEDTYEVETNDGKVWLRLKQSCAMDRYLSGSKIAAEGKADDARFSYALELKNGEMNFEMPSPDGRGSRGMRQTVSEKVITTFALFRVVSILPQRKEFRFDFDFMEPEEMTFENGRGHRTRYTAAHTLTCIGEEEVTVEGKNMKAWKWKHAGRSERREKNWKREYWVKDQTIVRAMIDGGEWIFTAKDP